jgi:hypothetical protein
MPGRSGDRSGGLHLLQVMTKRFDLDGMGIAATDHHFSGADPNMDGTGKTGLPEHVDLTPRSEAEGDKSSTQASFGLNARDYGGIS